MLYYTYMQHVFQEDLVRCAVNTYANKAWLDSLLANPLLNTKAVSIKSGEKGLCVVAC